MVVAVIMVMQLRCCRTRIAEPIAWLFVAVFGLSYYVMYYMDYNQGVLDSVKFNWLSIGLRVHFLVTLIVIEVTRWWRMRRKA